MRCASEARGAQVGKGHSSGTEGLESAAGQGTQSGTCEHQAALDTAQPHASASGASLQSKSPYLQMASSPKKGKSRPPRIEKGRAAPHGTARGTEDGGGSTPQSALSWKLCWAPVCRKSAGTTPARGTHPKHCCPAARKTSNVLSPRLSHQTSGTGLGVPLCPGQTTL